MAAKNKNVQMQPNKFKRLVGTPFRLSVLIVLVLVLAGGGTVAAANSSKPGDILYGVDRAAEQVRLALSFTKSMKEATYRSMAKERLTEIQALFDEKNIDSRGIATALANFQKQKSKASDLAKDTDHAQEVENELNSYQFAIDNLFEQQQAALEQQRENLKQQAEAADSSGNAALASQLRTQAATLDAQLKVLEAKREVSKVQEDNFSNALDDENKDSSNDSKDAQEAFTEAVKDEVEAKSEADKKASEAQSEADKNATTEDSGQSSDGQDD